MNTYYQQLNDIADYKITLAHTGKSIGIKSIIKYYGIVSYLVLKKHYPDIQRSLGETFASFIGVENYSIDPLERTATSVTFKYLTRVQCELVLLIDEHTYYIGDRVNYLAEQDHNLLSHLIRNLDCYPGLFRYLTKHQPPEKSAEYYAAKFRNLLSGKEIVPFKSLLNSIFGELEKMTTTEFRSIQENIYAETVKAFNDLKKQEALKIAV